MKKNLLSLGKHNGAFSMVEVVLALGIMSFCVIALVGVFSVGVSTGRESAEELQAAGIAQSLLATRRALPDVADSKLDGIPLPTVTVSGTKDNLMLAASGTLTAKPEDARYRFAYRIIVPPKPVGDDAVSPLPISVWMRFSWPAQVAADKAKGTYELSTYLPQPQP